MEEEEFELDLGGWLEDKWKEKTWEDTNDEGNLSTGREKVSEEFLRHRELLM